MFPPYLHFRLVRMSSITTTSFLGKAPWTGENQKFRQLNFGLFLSETSSSTTPNWWRTMWTRSAVSNLNPADLPNDRHHRHHDDHLADDLHGDDHLADLLPDRLLSVLARYLLHKNLCWFKNTFVLAPICSKSYSIEWLKINLLPCGFLTKGPHRGRKCRVFL